MQFARTDEKQSSEAEAGLEAQVVETESKTEQARV